MNHWTQQRRQERHLIFPLPSFSHSWPIKFSQSRIRKQVVSRKLVKNYRKKIPQILACLSHIPIFKCLPYHTERYIKRSCSHSYSLTLQQVCLIWCLNPIRKIIEPLRLSIQVFLLLPSDIQLYLCITEQMDLFYHCPQKNSFLFQYLSSVLLEFKALNHKFSVLHTPPCISNRAISILQKQGSANKLHYQAQMSQ